MNNKNAEWDIYADLADKKSAFGKIAIDCMFILSDKKHLLYENLLKSHALFSIGFQLYDDVIDFEQDIKNHQFNWAVYQLNKKVDLSKKDLLSSKKLLFIKGVAQEVLNKSICFFEQAKDILSHYKIKSEWFQAIKEMQNTIEFNIDNIDGYIKYLVKKIKLESITTTDLFFKFDIQDNTIIKGLNYIKKDFSHQYANLKHVMFLSKFIDGFDNSDEVHISDTFQRAMLNNCLLDICKNKNIPCNEYIDKELQYLINLRNKDDIGGWSYFPTVKEIAADIDDLGEIMRLFIQSEHKDYIDQYCLKAINIALNSKYNKNGGISTWIIPNENRTEIQNKQILFNETKWGTGPDIEVVANFIYALHLYDKDKYKQQIKAGINFILESQNEDGYWLSKWYYGNLYGTYVCMRLLKHYQNDETSLSIKLATDFLLYSQNSDGGFGMNGNGKSEMLHTALAILGLKTVLDNDDTTIKKAKQYLLSNQNDDGSWNMSDFIKPRTGDPYKSKTMTTAIVLNALL